MGRRARTHAHTHAEWRSHRKYNLPSFRLMDKNRLFADFRPNPIWIFCCCHLLLAVGAVVFALIFIIIISRRILYFVHKKETRGWYRNKCEMLNAMASFLFDFFLYLFWSTFLSCGCHGYHHSSYFLQHILRHLLSHTHLIYQAYFHTEVNGWWSWNMYLYYY